MTNGATHTCSGHRLRTPDFLPLHSFELRILLVLAEGPTHGYSIIGVIDGRVDLWPVVMEVRDGSWKRVLPANLYRRLRDMHARGLVEEVDAPAGTPEDERQRRTYALTELGRRIAVAEARRLDALAADARRVLREV